MHFGLEGITPTLLYFAAIGACLASVFYRPEIGLYYLVPLLPPQTLRARMMEFPLGNKLIDMILLGVILGVIFRRDYKLFPKAPLRRFLLVFAIALYLSLCQGSFFLGTALPWSISDPRFSLWKNYMVMPLLFALTLSVIRETKQIKIFVGLMCFSTLLASKSVYNAVGSRNLSQFSYQIRDGGAFGYAGANGAGAFEAWFVLLLLALFAYEKRPLYRLALLGLAVFSVYCLMLTFSRGAYLAFIVGLLLLAMLKERRIFLLLIPFLFTWQTLVPQSVVERVSTTQQGGELEASAAERVQLWDDVNRIIPQNPILGTGFNTYQYMHLSGVHSGDVELTDTHNYYLKMMLETGVVGVGFFITLLALMARLAWRLYRRAKDDFLRAIGLGLVPGVLSIAISNMFGDRWQYIEEVGFLWVLMACVIRGSQVDEQEPVQSQEHDTVEQEFETAAFV
jgi:putative inorganic carbon (hco3(-)) transporter